MASPVVNCITKTIVQSYFYEGTILVGSDYEEGGDWCQGYILDHNSEGGHGDEGVFPTNNYCWKLDSFAYLKVEDKNRCSKSKMLKFAQVVHGMSAQLEEEIDLVEGQIVTITDIIDKDWYRYAYINQYIPEYNLPNATEIQVPQSE